MLLLRYQNTFLLYYHTQLKQVSQSFKNATNICLPGTDVDCVN